MDGYRRDDRVGPPAGLMELLRQRDPAELALRSFRELETLVPVEVPSIPVASDALDKLLRATHPSTVPEELREEFGRYNAAIVARVNAKSENVRRLRTALWCEAELRKHRRAEHIAVRLHNRQVWGMQGPASDDYSVREAQAKAHA